MIHLLCLHVARVLIADTCVGYNLALHSVNLVSRVHQHMELWGVFNFKKTVSTYTT